jgi:hypothetical protein
MTVLTIDQVRVCISILRMKECVIGRLTRDQEIELTFLTIMLESKLCDKLS